MAHLSRMENGLFRAFKIRAGVRSLRTHKVSNGPETPVLVLLQKTHHEGGDGTRLPRRQLQRLVEDCVIHFPHITAVEWRLKESGRYEQRQSTSSRKTINCIYQGELLSAEQSAHILYSQTCSLNKHEEQSKSMVRANLVPPGSRLHYMW